MIPCLDALLKENAPGLIVTSLSAIDSAQTSEHLIVTWSGQTVAEFPPLRRNNPDPATLLARWRHLLHVDANKIRRDIDGLILPAI